MTPDTDGNCPNHQLGAEMWACGDGTCVFKEYICDYLLAPQCPDNSDLLYCRNRTAEKKERGCKYVQSNAYTCLDRSLKDDSGVPEDEESMKRETEKRRVPNSPPNCTENGLYPCTGYYPNTCGTKDVCIDYASQFFGRCMDYSSYTCLSKSKAEGCRDMKEGRRGYFQCNKSGYYKTNQIIQRFLKVLHYIYCFYLL